MINKRQVRIENDALAAALKLQPGSIVGVPCKNGVPLEREWRNRFRDMEIDNCIAFVDSPVQKQTPKSMNKEIS